MLFGLLAGWEALAAAVDARLDRRGDMAQLGHRTRYGRPTRGTAVPPRSHRGRLCDNPGCATILSIYNTSPTCWLHVSRWPPRSPLST